TPASAAAPAVPLVAPAPRPVAAVARPAPSAAVPPPPSVSATPLPTPVMAASTARPVVLPANAGATAVVGAVPPPAPTAALPPPPSVSATPLPTPMLAASTARPVALPLAAAPTTVAGPVPPPAPLLAGTLPPTDALMPEAPAAAPLPPAPAPVSGTRPASPPNALAAQAAAPQPAPALDLPSERQVATLAPEDAPGVLPATALAAFLRPGDILPDADALAVRDGIAATLAQFPCARLQSGFNPDTGTLDLRGHIPDPEMRQAVIGSLQAQLGPGIPINGDLRILPRPQCQMLAAIDAIGLPQSSEQYTNPRVIGPDAHVRDYRFAEGDRLELDLTAPDYPAYVLVDYFDAQGNVLHLQPNDFVPAVLSAPKAMLTIGRERDGQPALVITVSPPFGQEIAVAFASSAPIFDTLRPLVEPAAPYLADLARRIAEARSADPQFKGEWVYFLVTTAPQ
ncbi:MAG: DUF4384 domain-containing protein, partial [Gemmobacter sp.]|nr:DUF4384 domain-containing protein [Gemmobacter sp.]